MTTATCHCGAVSLDLARKPTEVFECNCSICRKLGVIWAYYHCDEVVIAERSATTNQYIWADRILAFHSCPNCGCTTHWAATDPTFREKMGVNARLIDGVNPMNTPIHCMDHGEIGWFWTQQKE